MSVIFVRLLEAYLIYLVIAFLLRRFIVYPGAYLRAKTTPLPNDLNLVKITADGPLGLSYHGFLLPNPHCAFQDIQHLVIYFHGNFERADYRLATLQGYHALGYSVFVPEYPGFDGVSTKPSAEAIDAAIDALFAQLPAHYQQPGSHRIYHGQSLGGGIAARTAGRKPPHALILQQTFLSLKAMARGMAAPSFFIAEEYPTDQFVAKANVPTLMMHGTKDVRIPVYHARGLKKANPAIAYWETNWTHNRWPMDSAYFSRIASFLKDHALLPMAE